MLTKHRVKRQQLIVDTARELFARRGIEETTMDDIAVAAGLTRRTLYAYFRSRDEVSLSVLIEDMTARWERQKAAIEPAVTGLDKIIAWAESHFEFAVAHPGSMHLHLYWDLKGMDPGKLGQQTFEAFEAINDDLARGLRRIFRLGIRDGSLRPDLKVDLGISIFLYSLRAALHRAISTTYSFAQFKPDKYFSYYLDLFTRAIRNPERNPT